MSIESFACAADPPEKLFEVINGGWNEQDKRSIERWIGERLLRGFKVAAMGSSDMHRKQSQVGKSFTGVLAPELTRQAILEALRAGRTMASTGPLLTLWSRDAGCVPDGSSPESSRAQSCGWSAMGSTVDVEGSTSMELFAAWSADSAVDLCLFRALGEAAESLIPIESEQASCARLSSRGAVTVALRIENSGYVRAAITGTDRDDAAVAFTSPIYFRRESSGGGLR
jgi:hypothetical protein